MGAKPAPQEGPKPFHGIHMDFTKAVPIFISGVLSPSMIRVSKSGRVGLIFVPGIWTLCTSYPLISWHLARFRGARHSGCVYPGSHDLSHQSPIASGDGPCQEDA